MHFERTEQARLARTENFVSYHPQLGRVLMAGKVPARSVRPGQARLPVQGRSTTSTRAARGTRRSDAAAYMQFYVHDTALIAIEPATVDNGCLEFAAGRHAEGLIGLTADGVLSKESEAELEFNPCEMAPGDVTIFSSYVPHRSSPNLSGKRRALLYLTYNAQNEGYLRDEYYRHKRANLKSGQLSLIKHFQGVAMDDANGGTNATAAAAGEGSCASGEEHRSSSSPRDVRDQGRDHVRPGGDTAGARAAERGDRRARRRVGRAGGGGAAARRRPPHLGRAHGK